MEKPWVLKYAPKNRSEIAGHTKEVDEIFSKIKNFKPGKGILILGGIGTGKTCSIEAIAKELNYDLVEFNSSETRNAAAINENLGKAIGQHSLFFSSKIILIDEVDCFSGVKDRGGIQALAKVILKSKFPIVMTAKSADDKKLKPLKKVSEKIEFETINNDEIVNILKKICDAEKVKYTEDGLNRLARTSGGDLRAVINDLQSLSYSIIDKENVETISERNREEKIVNALIRVFKTTDADIARRAYEDLTENIDDLFLWIEENLPKEYLDMVDLRNGFDTLSLADVYKGRIMRWQYYRFYTYIYPLLSAGISLSKSKKYTASVKYSQPGRILKMWWANQKNMRGKAIAGKISEELHVSSKYAFSSVIPFLKYIAINGGNKINEIASYYELEKEDVEWLRK